uniref:Uncharacterized protein n=1 Tax=Marseillevirus LCMAC101 TaxID=2506602 RepID=A0A481YRI8_9VIRU|nr:MAG: hypothetical protein LCMAC101_04030 [Marseillevirus LCMAC101]
MGKTCKYCDGEYSTKHSLLRHQQTNIKCLKLRNKEKITDTCEYCKKEYVHLVQHQKTCKEKSFLLSHRKEMGKLQSKLDRKTEKFCTILEKDRTLEKENAKLKTTVKKLEDENSSLKDKISELEGVITGLKTAPDKKTIYNTAIHPKLVNLPINNIRALTDEFIQERVDDGILTYEKASRGYPGMLEIICELITHENDDGIVERNYVCTDVSRNSFHRLLESKKWRSDKGGRYLNNMLDTFQNVMEDHKNKAYENYEKTPHESFEWEQVNWERKNISKLYSGVVCKEGNGDREELINILRKEISKRASV